MNKKCGLTFNHLVYVNNDPTNRVNIWYKCKFTSEIAVLIAILELILDGVASVTVLRGPLGRPLFFFGGSRTI